MEIREYKILPYRNTGIHLKEGIMGFSVGDVEVVVPNDYTKNMLILLNILKRRNK